MSTTKEQIEALAQRADALAADIRAIDLGTGTNGGTAPVMSVAAPASVQLDKAAAVTVAADASLDADSPDDAAGADWTIVGVAAQHFDGGTVPGGKIAVPKGQRKGNAQWKMAPHAGKYFQAKAQLVLSNPNLVTLASDTVDVTVSGGTQDGGGWKSNSGLPWPSGVTTPSNDTKMFGEIDWFAKQRGSPVDIINVKSRGQLGFNELISAINEKGPIYAEAAKRNMLISQVVDIPKQENDVITRIISGACDQQWKQIGLALNSYPLAPGAHLTIRLDHEIPFTIGTDLTKIPVATYLKAWNHVAAILKGTIHNVRIEWNTLRSLGQFSLAQLYPGDDYVDVIGNDPYGNTAIPNDAAMAQYISKYLAPYAALARQHGKLIGFAEWATTNTVGPHSAYDSPAYIRGMFNFFKQNADIMSHEIYFHINDKSSQGGGHNHLLFGPDANSPDAAAECKRLWSAG